MKLPQPIVSKSGCLHYILNSREEFEYAVNYYRLCGGPDVMIVTPDTLFKCRIAPRKCGGRVWVTTIDCLHLHKKVGKTKT